MSDLTHPWGTLTLYRWPRQRNESLQAWDNADRYLLNTLAERGGEGGMTLVVNDSHGALGLAASQRGEAVSSGDSWMAWHNMSRNAAENRLSAVRHCWPDETLPASPQQVLMRVPKSLALLESQLAWLAAHLSQGTPVWLCGMDKHLPRQLVPLMQRYLGNGQAEYGWKKARLFSARAPGGSEVSAPYPTLIDSPVGPLKVHAGVFSQQQLDIGARCFLEHLPDDLPEAARVADLGCGNGVIGLSVLKHQPHAQITFCDESWLALKSARENAAGIFPDARTCFHHGDGLAGVEETFDVILLNPPFHEGHIVGDHVARRLFRQASRHLAEGGELRVIGNRHLGYHKPLGRLFRSVERVGNDSKFVVFSCREPK